MNESESHSVVSNSSLPCGQYSPWNSPDQNIGVSNPGVEPRSLALQVDSSADEPQEKPKNTGVGSLSLFQGSFQPRNQTGVSCIAGRFYAY